MEEIFADGFANMHTRLDITGEVTMKAVIRNVVRDCFPKLSIRRKELFRRGAFGQFLDIPTPHGDNLLVHTMMLHEVRSHALARAGRFGFNVQGINVQYGSLEFCLITGLRFGPFTNILGGTKDPKTSKLRSRLFKNETDQTLRLSHLENLILGPRFEKVGDDDAVMIMQMFLLLRGMLGRELNTCIPPLVLELADNHRDWNRYCWGSLLWSYTEVQMRQIFKKQEEYIQEYGGIEGAKTLKFTVLGFMYPFKIWIWETFPESQNYTLYTSDQYPRIRCWRSRAALRYGACCSILNVSLHGNDPRQLEATPVEMVMRYYIRYMAWTNNKREPSPTEETPPQSDREDTVSEREHTPTQSPSRTGELSATSISSHFPNHMSGDKPAGHKKEKKRSKNPLHGLARVVKKLATQVNLVSEKIDRWDRYFKSQEFCHKEMPKREADETFFHGMEHLNETLITRAYEKSPTEVVDLGDITIGRIKTPRPKRKKKASKYIISPNVQIATTPRIKKKRTKKSTSLTLPQRDESDHEEAEEVRNVRLLLDIAVSNSGEFWPLWSSNINQLLVKHQFYPEFMNWEFWSTLIGVHAKGWLETSHVTIWSRCLMEVRPRNGRCILKELDKIFYWDTVALSQRKTHIPEFVEAEDVPQQELGISRGDCGVFVCMFMEMLVSNVALRIDHSNSQSAILYRNKMANYIWEMRGV